MSKNKIYTLFNKKILFLGFLSVLLSLNVNAQKITRIKGTVLDAKTKEPLPFVNVTFKGKNIGTTTDFDGQFYIETQWATTKLLASFVGYKTAVKTVTLGKSQTVNFLLKNDAIEMETFEVKADKKRYRNKDNPAVALIKNVIKHKDDNRKEALDFYEYDKYEKIELDLNNITQEFLDKGWLKKFQVIRDHVDTSEINGKPYLPIFLRETASKMYYRKKPKTLKEYQSGSKMTGFEGYLDDDGMSFIMDKLYQDIDVYDNNISLLSNQFTSPISSLGATIYKYFIIDTTIINGNECINLAFTPRNKSDFAFVGNMYILNDSSTYAVTKIKMGVADQINLNFIRDMIIDQEYTLYQDSVWMLSKDHMVIDYNLSKKGRGLFGRKTISYNNFEFNKEREKEIYSPVEKIIKAEDLTLKTDSFWDETRPDTLTEREEGVYMMIDSVQNIPAFKRFMNIAMLIVTGWQSVGKVEVGPVNTFYSFNQVEGFRLRGGFRTTPKFNKKMMFDTYVAYGFKDKKFKYFGGFTYSFNDEYLKNPQNRIIFSYQHETNFPGQDLLFLNDDNFLLSFKRGKSNKMFFFDDYKIDYNHESKSGFAYNLIYQNKTDRPVGALDFISSDSENPIQYKNIKTDRFSLNLRFAPNEQYYQGKNFRLPIPNKYPIFDLRITQGIKGFIDGEYEYTRTVGRVFKRFYLAQLGFTDTELEGGKIFGQVPFALLHMPQANQSFFLQEPSFNMMNFMEFMSDEYVSFKITHNFNGFILNKIPLIRHLKWREIISAKILYGRLTSQNNTALNPNVFLFPTNKDGVPITYTFNGDIPYVELSAGISNIFKVIRIDLLQRVTYLDNIDVGSTFGVKGLGIRAKGKIDF